MSYKIINKHDPLPDFGRLMVVWRGADSVSRFEHAARMYLALWGNVFANLTASNMPQWSELLVSDGALEANIGIARVIDDEVTWCLGNRPDLVALVEDYAEGLVTVGELVGRIAMIVVLLDKTLAKAQSPLAAALVHLGRQYDELAADLNSGRRAQPRRRWQGAPPVPRPGRFHLTATPTDGR